MTVTTTLVDEQEVEFFSTDPTCTVSGTDSLADTAIPTSVGKTYYYKISNFDENDFIDFSVITNSGALTGKYRIRVSKDDTNFRKLAIVGPSFLYTPRAFGPAGSTDSKCYGPYRVYLANDEGGQVRLTSDVNISLGVTAQDATTIYPANADALDTNPCDNVTTSAAMPVTITTKGYYEFYVRISNMTTTEANADANWRWITARSTDTTIGAANFLLHALELGLTPVPGLPPPPPTTETTTGTIRIVK
jgi:hypothetical protein